MRIIKRMQMILLLLVVGFVVIGCDEKDPPKKDVLPTKVVVSGLKDLKVDESVTLKATVTPTNATNKNVSWSIDNDTLATITPNGSNCTVKALKEGKVKITVKCTADELVTEVLEINITKEVIIEPIKAESIELSGEEEVFLNKEITLTANVLPVDAADKKVVWSSSDENIATVKDGVVTPVAVGVVTITCTLESDSNIKASKEITVKEEVIVIKTTAITIKGNDSVIEGKEITLSVEYEPSDATDVGVNWSSSDETIAIIENGVLKGIKAGTVTVTATLIVDNTISNTFDVIVQSKVFPTAIDIIASLDTIDEGLGMVLNIAYTPSDTSETGVVWESSNEEIATIDEKGSFKAIKAGEVVITAKSVFDEKIISTKTIVVKGFEELMPDNILIEAPTSIFVGDTIRVQATVIPAGCVQSVTWKVNNESYASINSEGFITGLSEGRVRIKAISTVNGKESSWYSINVEKRLPPPPVPDMSGYVIEIMNADSSLGSIDPNRDDYNASDREFRKRAWIEVKSKFNCDFKAVPYPNEAPWGPTRITWINSLAATQTPGADIYVISSDWIPGFVNANSIVKVTDYYKRYSNNQMELASYQAASYKGELYAIATGLTETKNYINDGLFYNLGLIEKYNIESPAKMFNEGRWTYTDFKNWCLAAQSKLASDEWVCSGAPQIYWAGMVQAGGVKLADSLNLRLNLTHNYSLGAIQALKDIVKGGAWDVDGIDYDQKVVSFQSGKAIMQVGEYWFVDADNRFKSNMWGEGDETRYGYVPFPYPDNVKKENTFVNLVGDSIYAIAAGRENKFLNFGYEEIYYAYVQTHLLTIEYQKADEKYDPEAIKNSYLRSKLDDVESIQAALFYTASKTIYDPIFDGVKLNYSGTPATTVMSIVVNDEDAISKLEAVKGDIENTLIELFG